MSVKRQFASSSLWILAGTGANSLVAFIVFAVLARLLDPHTLGVVAFAAIFIDVGRIIVFGGLPEAVVQRESWDHEVSSTCFTANLSISIVFLLLVSLVLAPVLSFTYSPEIGPVLAVLAASYVIDAVRVIHEAKLRREFQYKLLAARASVANALSGIVGVGMAVAGYGVWALVAQRLVSATITTLLTWRAARWTPTVMISWPILRSLSNFIFHLTPARLLSTFSTKLPEFMIGLVLGTVAIAYYRVGSRGLDALSKVSVQPIQQTALSAFSRLPNPDAIANAYNRLTRATALIVCPLYLGIAVTSPDAIVLLFGHQWAQSAPIMSALALMVGCITLSNFIQPALTAAGKTGRVLSMTIGTLIANVLTTLVTVWYGPTAVALGNTARAYLSLPFWFYMLKQGIPVRWQTAVGGILPPLAAAAGMALILLAMRWYLMDGLAPIVRLPICALCGGVIYVALLMLFARKYLRVVGHELVPLLPKRLRRFFGG